MCDHQRLRLASRTHPHRGSRRRPTATTAAFVVATVLASSLGNFAASPAVAGAQAHSALPAVELVEVASGVGGPTSIAAAGDGRLYVSVLEGQVWILAAPDSGDVDGVLDQPFLDLEGEVAVHPVKGLLGLAFHPDYPANPTFFVHYIDPADNGVIARFARSATDPLVADPASKRVLLTIPHQLAGHNGGQLAFGPDGYLYASLGDDGGIRDPNCNAQNPATLLGKILRLDVDSHADSPPYHAIPPDNPFVGATGGVRPEIWALGLRNPWRFSFDRATGDMYVADVGQDDREELDWEPATSPGGRNYGWKRLEGTLCFADTSGCAFPVEPCDSAAYTAPVLELDHDGGDCSITGGYVYRGLAIPGLTGRYLFGDFCSGNLRATLAGAGAWSAEPLGVTLAGVTTFGEDQDGEILVAAGESVYRLVPSATGGTCRPDDITLCALDGRFMIRTYWASAAGQGYGHAVPFSADSGSFWFFNPANTEILVKIHDACVAPFNGFWVFAAGLTDVQVEITVTDIRSGRAAAWFNPIGTAFVPVQDTAAFRTCDAGAAAAAPTP